MTEFESCEKCKHYAKGSEDYPCNNCTNNAIDHYEPMSNEDRMTIDEAIRILNIQRTFTFTKESNAKVEAIDMAIEALEKQIPKKPIPNQLGTKRKKLYSCPSCQNALLTEYANERQNNNFCWDCGQRLDWSDEE